MENQITETAKPSSLKEQIVEGIKLIASICIVGGLIYAALYYGKNANNLSNEDAKLEFFQKQSEVLQKHIATNDSILFHLINENKTLRTKYDSIVKLSLHNSPDFLPIFSK
jgi:predicted histidine transporter YuiF (NhaC family)